MDRQGTRFIDYALERDCGKPAASLVDAYPRAESFEAMYAEALTGAGAAEAPPA